MRFEGNTSTADEGMKTVTATPGLVRAQGGVPDADVCERVSEIVKRENIVRGEQCRHHPPSLAVATGLFIEKRVSDVVVVYMLMARIVSLRDAAVCI